MSRPRTSEGEATAAAWLEGTGAHPFPYQRDTWRRYLAGESGLIHAPTGTGKTLAAWLGPLAEWLDEHPDAGAWPRPGAVPLRVLWVTPLRALAADTVAALRRPVNDIGLPWTVERRTGDVSSSVRARQKKRLPTALVITPESLSLLLTHEDAAERFAHLRCVVVDEWHELLGSKRGVQTQLALARLRRWAAGLRTWGLSATLGNIAEARQSLLGSAGTTLRADVDKPVRIDTVIPASIDRFPWAGHMGLRQRDAVAAAIEASGSALVFTNTRAQCEAWYQALCDALPHLAERIGIHHGSLDGDRRAEVEAGLAEGRLRAVVCTSSLDLGVDFQPVERVFQVGSPKGVARLVQRAGRSGHRPGVESRVTCVPAHAFELVEVAAARSALAQGRVESRPAPRQPIDVLVQHLVTAAVGGGFEPGALLEEVRSTASFRELDGDAWQWALDFTANGGRTLSAYPEYRRIVLADGAYRVRDDGLARRHRMAVGTITSDAAMRVKYLRGADIGLVEEAFVARLRPGDRFIVGGKTLELVRLRDQTAYVRRAKGRGGAIPRWMGGRLPLSTELAESVGEKLAEARDGVYDSPEMEAMRPVLELQGAWSGVPGHGQLLVERFKTRQGWHLVLFPFAGRLAHQGLAAVLAHRLARVEPATYSLAVNDYGLELLSREPAPLEAALQTGLFSTEGMEDDIAAGLNLTELARRHFREIARVAGLVWQGLPHAQKSAQQLQASSGLFFEVFRKHDPGNRLLRQAYAEVLEKELEAARLRAALQAMAEAELVLREPPHPTPMAFPLVVEQMRERLSTETLEDRVRRMQVRLERAAGSTA